MSGKIRKIKIKRIFSGITAPLLQAYKLDCGEPLIIKEGINDYLAFGTKNNKTFSSLPLFKSYQREIVDNGVFFKNFNNASTPVYNADAETVQLVDDTITPDGTSRKEFYPLTKGSNVFIEDPDTHAISNAQSMFEKVDDSLKMLDNKKRAGSSDDGGAADWCKVIDMPEDAQDKYYITSMSIGQEERTPYDMTPGYTLNKNESIYIQNSILKGSGWNDYAEYRPTLCRPGTCVVELSNGIMVESYKKNLPNAFIVSDTCGVAIGEEKDSMPVAVAGRVLAYVDCEVSTGDIVMSSDFGRLTKMPRKLAKKFPERIVGVVGELPTYATWGKHEVKVDGRVWINLK